MATITINDHNGFVGTTRTHHVPRRGDFLVWRDLTWMVDGVCHPTQDDPGSGIHAPRVYAHVVLDLPWYDYATTGRSTATP